MYTLHVNYISIKLEKKDLIMSKPTSVKQMTHIDENFNYITEFLFFKHLPDH